MPLRLSHSQPPLKFFDRIAMWVATGGYSGNSPMVPATVGSFVGLLLYLPMANEPATIHIVLTIAVFGLGVWLSGRAEQLAKVKDARPIVIDEIVGMWISLLFLPPRVGYWLSAFILFRVFDVWKPFPANHAQRLKGGWGIMMDDVLAGIYTNAALHLVKNIAAF